MKFRKIRWKDASKKLPKKDNDRPKYSVRVLIWWTWPNNSEPRFGTYSFEGKCWMIEGITGNFKVIAWAYIHNPILEA